METVSIISGILGIFIAAGGFTLATVKMFNKIAKRFEQVEESAKYRKEESIILIKATLAICEGLIQLKCNGPVTTCRDALQEYLIKRGE
jgi:hypothetical protein